MLTVPALTDRTEAQRWAEVRDEEGLWGDLRPELLEAVRRILETTMEDELATELIARRYERTPWRTDLRNGSYRRTLVTELGAIIDLRVPRRRLVPYRPSFLRRAARRTDVVDGVLRQAFLRGLSTRETATLAETLTGVSLSPSSVSRLARALDAQVAAYHRRPITFAARYVLLDGLWVSVRSRAGRGPPGGSSSPRTASTSTAAASSSTTARPRPSRRPSGAACCARSSSEVSIRMPWSW
jgi:transposase-like protein